MATCEVAGTWYPAWGENQNRLGVTVNNQHATANFWISDAPDRNPLLCKRIPAGAIIGEDIMPSQSALYVMSDVAGATLTAIEKFNVRG